MTGKYRKNSKLQAIGAALRLLIACFLLLPISACVTTSAKKSDQVTDTEQTTNADVSKQANPTCGSEAGQPESKNGQTQQEPQLIDSCVPKGIIQITENHTLDSEVQQEFDKAVVLLKEENFEEAIRLLKSVTAKAGKFTGPHINLGIAYIRIGELDKAEESLQKALELNYLHPVARNELGLVYRRTGRYEEARSHYETLLKLHPDFLPARKNYGVLCDIYIQDLSCALEQYEAYLEGIPDDDKVKIWVADVKSRM